MAKRDIYILQTNLNHLARAQDLLVQIMAKCGTDLAVVSEPYRVPDHPDWLGDKFGTVFVFVFRSGEDLVMPHRS